LLAVGACKRNKDGDRYGGMMIVRKILKCEEIRQLPQQIRREIPNAVSDKKAFAPGTTAQDVTGFLVFLPCLSE
jgi:hypothetical protein